MVQFHWATRTTVFWYWSWKIIFVFCLLGKHAPLCSALTQANYLQTSWGMWHVTTWGMLGENVRHTHAAPIWTSLTICTCTGLVHCGHYVAGGKEQTRAHFSWAGFGVFLGGGAYLYLLHGSTSGEVPSMDEHIAGRNIHLTKGCVISAEC